MSTHFDNLQQEIPRTVCQTWIPSPHRQTQSVVVVQRKLTGFHGGTFGDKLGACGREIVIGRLRECAKIAQLPRDWFWNAWRSAPQRL